MARLPESFRELLAETAVEMRGPDGGARTHGWGICTATPFVTRRTTART